MEAGSAQPGVNLQPLILQPLPPEEVLSPGTTATLVGCVIEFEFCLHNILDFHYTFSYEYFRGGYGKPVDVWSIGCILGELSDGQPVFPGESEIDQLFVIQKIIGPLTSEQMHLFSLNPRFRGLKFPSISNPVTLRAKYVGILSSDIIDFMEKSLILEPKERPTIEECMGHPAFHTRDSEPQKLSKRSSESAMQIPKAQKDKNTIKATDDKTITEGRIKDFNSVNKKSLDKRKSDLSFVNSMNQYNFNYHSYSNNSNYLDRINAKESTDQVMEGSTNLKRTQVPSKGYQSDMNRRETEDINSISPRSKKPSSPVKLKESPPSDNSNPIAKYRSNYINASYTPAQNFVPPTYSHIDVFNSESSDPSQEGNRMYQKSGISMQKNPNEDNKKVRWLPTFYF